MIAKTGTSQEYRQRIALIGGGVAGLTAAWLLQHKCEVHLFDPNDYAGGHTRTIMAPEANASPTPVDIGFIVMNHSNYPLLTRLFKQLGIELDDSDMSFSYHDKTTGYAYNGTNLRGLFAGPGTLRDPKHWKMIRDILRFNRCAAEMAETGEPGDMTLGEFIDHGQYSQAFEERYLLPMSAAIWSAPLKDMRNFPALSIVHFFKNHGLLSVNDRPQWRYVVGGSQTYVQRMLENFDGELHLNCGAKRLHRDERSVRVDVGDGKVHTFDYAIVATHADEALALLADPSPDEAALLGAWTYQPNSVVLHTDASVMPRTKRAWASWNAVSYGEDIDQPVALSYHMNRLQKLSSSRDYFVSLNLEERIDPEHVIHRERFNHPVYNFASVATQKRLPSLNGVNRTLFCGSYFGYGFHEDAVRSAVDAAAHFGVAL